MKKKYIIVAIIVLALVSLVYLGVRYKKQDSLRPRQDEISRKLPKDASTVRLNLPVALNSLMVSSKKGLGGLGIETEDSAKMDYIWLDVKSDTTINSWASGQITKINKTGDNEYEVIISYANDLWARHQKMKDLQVKEGDMVREGQGIGKGPAGSQPNSSQVIFSLADPSRQNGAKSTFSDGVIVAPLDYLKPDVKMFFLEKYR